MNIGKAIKSIRKIQGLPQSDLAKKSGLYTSSISVIERGVATPRLQTVEAIANALDVPVLVLFVLALEEEEKKQIPPMLLGVLDSWAMEIVTGLIHTSGENKVDTV